ncbi:autotransporter assembly complex protein TamB [Tatumella ptyseos]|uniref:autotransporter assembly complex protein TamB n=1 Tax=Tatumella ptyseos TaxID=82987 RepID=UPI0023F458C2|nr:translocation/assembly module TamB domain-containing protein [Tatumella ptyseos]
MTLWKKVLTGILVFLLLLIVIIGVLIGTAPGLHLVLNSAARWVPGLKIQQVNGGWKDLTIKGLGYQMPGVSVSGGELHLSLDARCLIHSSVCVNDITLKDVSVVVDSSKMAPSSPSKSEDKSSGEISTPYPILLRHVALENVNVKVDDTAISLGSFSTGLNWQGRQLTLTPTRIENLLLALPKTKTAVASAATDTVVKTTGSTAVQNTETKKVSTVTEKVPAQSPADMLNALFAKPLLNLPEFRLPLDIRIDEILGEDLRLTGDTDITVNRLQLNAQAIDNKVDLQTLRINAQQGILSATGQATLSGDWPLNLTLNSDVNMAPVKGQKVKLVIGGAAKKQVNLSLNLSGPVRAQLQAMAQPAVIGLPFSLHLTSPQLRWPLSGKSEWLVNNLSLATGGKATDYTIAFRSSVSGSTIPPADISLDGKGNTEHFSLDKLHIGALQGSADVKALVDWTKAISWNSELTLAGINTAKQYPQWPSRLDGTITTRGSMYGGSWQVSVPTLLLKGNVKQNAVNVKGSLSGNSYNQWNIPGINVQLGQNRLDIKGTLDKKISLDADIDASHLDNALPGLGGVVKGSVKARGTLEAPEVQADLRGQALRWQQLQVHDFSLQGNVTSGKEIAGKMALRINQLRQDTLDIRSVVLDASGSEKQHQLRLTVEGKPVSGQLTLNGSFDRQQQRWQGTLSNTRFATPVGDWQLSKAVSLDYKNTLKSITIGSHCWLNPDAQICVPEPIVAGADGHARIQLVRVDLAMLKPLLPGTTQLKGVFSGDARVNWKAGSGLPTGNVVLDGKGVEVKQEVQGKFLPVAFDVLTLKASLVNGKAQLGWLIRLANNGQLDGNIQINDPQKARNLSGNININNFSLGLFNPVLVTGENIKGMLNSQLRLSGNLSAPRVYGQTALTDVDINGNFMPIDMTTGNLKLVFNGVSSTLEGMIGTRQGSLNLTGNADWSQLDNWRARIAAKGEKIRVTVPPMVRMDVSPDLVFEATPAAFNLDGRVDIPWARITVQSVPQSAVGNSSDLVMLDDNLQPIKPKTTSVPINSNLIIHIGNDVRLSAFGLDASLTGDLKVLQDKNGLGLNGQINIPSGRFHAYGQDLLVRKGQLQFSGPPSEPYVNLEAIRNPEATEDDVTAGIRVTGLADSPKVEVFSDPTMSQQEALSYLLRGQGLGSDGDSNALTSALIGLGVAQSGQVLGKIGETFGVSNLALDTTGVGDSQQVQVSGYVLPGLQVKYGVGLFDSLATLTLRYRLMPKLYLEAVSGVDQALDLLYQFEFQ